MIQAQTPSTTTRQPPNPQGIRQGGQVQDLRYGEGIVSAVFTEYRKAFVRFGSSYEVVGIRQLELIHTEMQLIIKKK